MDYRYGSVQHLSEQDRGIVYRTMCRHCGRDYGRGHAINGKERPMCYPSLKTLFEAVGESPPTQRSVTPQPMQATSTFLTWLTAPRYDTCAHGTAKGAPCKYC